MHSSEIGAKFSANEPMVIKGLQLVAVNGHNVLHSKYALVSGAALLLRSANPPSALYGVAAAAVAAAQIEGSLKQKQRPMKLTLSQPGLASYVLHYTAPPCACGALLLPNAPRPLPCHAILTGIAMASCGTTNTLSGKTATGTRQGKPSWRMKPSGMSSSRNCPPASLMSMAK